MSLIVQTNLSMLNIQNKYKINTGEQKKSVEKLSSGYKINRAADDAAGLAISEKMREQIRGLDRGTLNARDGVSWVQIGDGALGEVQDILHRMKEITIQSLNDTNTPQDRAALQAEFDALQSEIDKISENTMFNTKNIFNDHEPSYYQFEGNVKWDQGQLHVINAGANDLTIKYIKDKTSAAETLTISVPAGVYTTQELTDEIEDAVNASAGADKGIILEYTDEGTFNLNLEAGERIEEVSGSLSYLLYDVYEGGSIGALVGTTVFPNEYSRLKIAAQNNNMSFTIENFDGVQSVKDITIPDGYYTRKELIDFINGELAGTTVSAIEYGTGIKLTSNDSIITGFKGNMFKIDEGKDVYTSVFYDNVKYGNIYMIAGSFTGGAVIPVNSLDEEHRKFKIDSANNRLDFKANGSTGSISIIIPEGEYTMEQMVTKLNELFTNSNLELKADAYTSGGFQGIKITSDVKGTTSNVGLYSSSSAYETLFVKKVYNSYKTDAVIYKETTADKEASFTGSKQFSGSNVPLIITSGQNDKFTLKLDGTKYEITLNAGTYNSADDIKNEINDKLNGSGASAGYKDKIIVSAVDGKIKFTAQNGSGLMEILAEAVNGNKGYDSIFVGKNITYTAASVSNTGSSSQPPSVILNTPVDNPSAITAGNNKVTINVDGINYDVTLPVGDNVSHDDITDAIEKTIQEKTVTTDNTFQDVRAAGSTTDNNFSKSGSGKTNVTAKSYSNRGDSKNSQGVAGVYEYNIPAKVTIDVVIPDTVVINEDNNEFLCNINGNTMNMTLGNGTYTRSRLVRELQNKIDQSFGVYFGGAKVYLDSMNKIVIEARLNQKGEGTEDRAGEETSIGLDTSSGSFLKELHTTRTAASIITNSINSNINISAGSNTFDFSYTENGQDKNVSIALDEGNYDRNSFVSHLNNKLKEHGIGVEAALSGNGIKLTTKTAGDGNSISFHTNNGGTAVEAIFGEMETKKPASASANLNTQDNINIDGSTDTFCVKVNNTVYQLTLDHGTYTRNTFVDMLNEKFKEKGVGIRASLEGKKIRYTTERKGREASFEVTYSGGGTSMKAIYGETTKKYAGVKAEFTQDNKLKLTGTINGGKLSVSSGTGGILQTQEKHETDIEPGKVTGYASNKHAYIDGVNITEPVTIDQWNNELNFTYHDGSTSKAVSVVIPDGEYIFSELQAALQNELDVQLGADTVKVKAASTGIRIETEKTGSTCYMDRFSGDFYNKILCSTKEITENVTPKVQNGTAPKDTAYTIGRKNVKTKPVEIKKGSNDVLSLDFTYGGTVHKITMTLDSGKYVGNGLKDMIQDKLNEQLINMGLEENVIEVGIGGINSGVVGANDASALNFRLSQTVRLPAEGEYIIDGVSGSAAFSVFYQTDGELKESYIKGTKDISKGTTIEAGENNLVFDVDGITYDIQIPDGKYTSKEIIDEINNQLKAAAAPVTAEIEDGNLKIFHQKMGTHKITNVSGGAKKALFFQENGREKGAEGINLQLSSMAGNYMEIERPIVNTSFLNINSIAITRPKYANKALGRIDEALNKVSETRSMFGAIQNRLEHAINNNINTSENTQKSESGLRDTDMAEEMINYSKHNILLNAAQALMAQVSTDKEGVLKLLQ